MAGRALIARLFCVPWMLGAAWTYAEKPSLTFQDYLAMPLEELVNIPITSSTLTDKNIRTVPSSVTVFTRKQIQHLGINYLHELTSYVPAFQSFRQEESGDEYYHSARGHRSSTASREVLILIDGQRFNREFDNAIAAPMLSLGNIEKVEFIRGPGSAIYGSNAFLGVINITTVRGGNELMVSGGDNHHVQAQGLFSAEIDTWNMDLFINAFDDKGEDYTLEDSVTHTEDYASQDPYDGYDINFKVGRQDMQVNIMHFERQSRDYYVLGNTANAENETLNQYSSIQFQNAVDWTESFKSNYSLRYYEDSYKPETVFLGLSSMEQESHSTELKLDNDFSVNAMQTFQFGVEFRHSDIDEVIFKSSAFGADFLYPESNRDVTGVYFQSQTNLTPETQLLLGARYDDYSQIGAELSPRFGIVHQFLDTQTIKLLYGEAFRAPTTNELKLEDVFGAANLVGNPELEPEIVKTWELIWMNQWRQHYVAITLFNNSISDVISLDETVNPTTYINSSGEESSHGIELEYMGQLSSAWEWRTSYSYFENLSRQDFREADQLASIILDYQENKWNVNVSTSYSGERESPVPSGKETLGDYWLTNAKIQYFINAEQSLYLQAKNILDEDYETPYRGSTFYDALPNRGREFSVGMHWKF